MKPPLAARGFDRRARLVMISALLAVLSMAPTWMGAPAFGRSPSFGAHGLSPEVNPWSDCWYVRGEFLSLWAEGNRLPPLLTASPAGTPQFDAGVLGEPNTQILLGAEQVDDTGHLGGRLTVGRFLNASQTRAIEVELWTVAEGRSQDISDSQGFPVLARPFFNTESNQQDAQLIRFPLLVAGDIRANVRSEAHSVTALAVRTWQQGSTGYIDLFGGYRFFRFRESFEILEALQPAIDVIDNFDTENDFHGVELGGVIGIPLGRCSPHGWMLEVTTKIALGDMRQQLTINGSTVAAGVTTSGGWLTAPSNIGSHTDHRFAAIPTLGIQGSMMAFDIMRLSVGYDLLFVSKVLRAGEQIDMTVNPSQLAPLPLARGGGVPSGTARPAPRMEDTAMWLQGVSFGFELRW